MENEDEIPQPENEKPVGTISNAQNVSHAEVVNHAENVGKVEIHGEPVSNRARILGSIREISRSFVTFCALVVMVVVIVDKNNNENHLQAQLKSFQQERSASDLLTAKKLECVRRYTDAIDVETEKQLILIGEFLVVITQNAPGPEREAAVKTKIDELDRTNIAAREAMAAKINYNNQGNPLPCPLGPSPAPPVPPPPDAGVAITVSTTPTT